MATECKLCALLGATTCSILDNGGNEGEHSDLHARQSHLIEFDVEKPRAVPNGSDTTARNNGDVPSEGKLTKTVLFTFCRELVDSYGKNCGIKCSQCKISIKSQRSTASTTYNLINHSCVHLNKDLYACCHCDLKFISRGGIRAHLNKIHSKSGNSENYVDMTEDNQNDIMDMVKLCFGEAPDKKLDVTMFGRQKQNRKRGPLSKLAYTVTSKHEGKDLIQCHLCPRSIQCNHRGQAARSLVDHARWHLKKPIFTCRLCPYSASNHGTIRMHLKQTHSVAKSKENYKDVSIEHYEEISTVLEDCFGDAKKDRPPVLTKYDVQARKRQDRIFTRCGTNSLLAERKLRSAELAHKFHRSGKLQCRICHDELTVVNAKRTQCVSLPMHHAYSHFNKLLITCRQCSYKCMTKSSIGHHVRTKHGVPLRNQYNDNTADYQSDFMDMLSKCFDWDLEPSTSSGRSQGSSGSKKSKLRILSMTHDNDLKTARHILAHDLIKKHVKDGKMVCHVCNQTTNVTKKGGSINSGHIFNHALTHLDSSAWPYRCTLCSYTASNRSSICSHLRNAHKDGGSHGFEDVSDKFHEDILNIVSKCYEH